MKLLTILVSTLNNGISNLEKTIQIQQPEIDYLVIHQNHTNTPIPDFLKREDIKVIQTFTKGLSKSRNIGIKNCKTEYALIADDDIEYIEAGLLEILEIIKEDKPDFGTFKIKTQDNEQEFKDYLQKKHFFKDGYIAVASIELLVNIDKVKNMKVAFDERFGLGSGLRQGEEEIFIRDLTNYNFHGVYYPSYIVRHPFESTGSTPMKESKKYFFKGAYNKRIDKKEKLPNFDNLFRKYKNYLCFYLGRMYIMITKKTDYE